MILGKVTSVLRMGEFLQLRPGGFRPPTGKDIRAGHTPFHAPDEPPERLAQWPDKRLGQRSLGKKEATMENRKSRSKEQG